MDDVLLKFYRPKLYFVKLDVRACFDTIEQGLLLEIIQRIIEEVRITMVMTAFTHFTRTTTYYNATLKYIHRSGGYKNASLDTLFPKVRQGAVCYPSYLTLHRRKPSSTCTRVKTCLSGSAYSVH